MLTELISLGESFFRELVEDCPDIVCRFETNGALLYINPAAESYWGLPREALIGRDALEWLDSDGSAGLRQRLSALAPEDPKMSANLTLPTPGGPRQLRCFAQALFDDDNRQCEYQLVGRDVTDLAVSREALRRNIESFNQLADNLGLVVWLRDQDDRLFVSPAYERVFGRSVQTLSADAREFWDAVCPEDRERVRSAYERYLNDPDEKFREEYRIIRPDGEIRHVWSRSLSMRTDEGETYRAAGITVDMTDSRRLETQLRRADKILDAVRHAAELCLRMGDWEQAIADILARLGRAADVCRVFLFEIVGGDGERRLLRQRYEWVVPGLLRRINNPVLQALDMEELGLGDWARMMRRGEVAFGHVREAPAPARNLLEDEDVRSLLLAPIFVDDDWWGVIGFDECRNERAWSAVEIDALKAAAGVISAGVFAKQCSIRRSRLEARAQETQRYESLGLMAGGLAHDFNNLLSAIVGNAHLLEKLESDNPGARDLAGSIAAAAERAGDLTRQMLAYAGKDHFHQRSLDVNETLRRMRPLLDAGVSKKARLTLDMQEGLPAIRGDRASVQQVISNLAVNASEALKDKGGEIVISTRHVYCSQACLGEFTNGDRLAEGMYVRLEVRDTGCGIDSRAISRVFDPFYTTKFTGRGLGLAATLGIIKSHGGAIRVISQIGEGAAFQALFPPSGSPAELFETPFEEDDGLKADGLILVVDDEEMVRNVARRALERAGFGTIEASNGEDALELFGRRSNEIALVLLDMTMPRMSGAETMAGLRRIRPGAPIILTSGYSEEDCAGLLAREESVRFLQKPYRPDVLVARAKWMIAEARRGGA